MGCVYYLACVIPYTFVTRANRPSVIIHQQGLKGAMEGEYPTASAEPSFEALSSPSSMQAKTTDFVGNVGGDTTELSTMHVLNYETTGIISYCILRSIPAR